MEEGKRQTTKERGGCKRGRERVWKLEVIEGRGVTEEGERWKCLWEADGAVDKINIH